MNDYDYLILLISILKWLLISVVMNLSGNVIGIHGLFCICFLLLLSPVICWYLLYNLLLINVYNSKLLYILNYKFVNLYNYSFSFELCISLYEMIVVILLINVSYTIHLYILK